MKVRYYFYNIIIIRLAPLFTSLLSYNQILEISLTFKKANIADLNETPQNAGTSFGSSRVDKPYLPINQHAISDPIQCGCVR